MLDSWNVPAVDEEDEDALLLEDELLLDEELLLEEALLLEEELLLDEVLLDELETGSVTLLSPPPPQADSKSIVPTAMAAKRAVARLATSILTSSAQGYLIKLVSLCHKSSFLPSVVSRSFDPWRPHGNANYGDRKLRLSRTSAML